MKPGEIAVGLGGDEDEIFFIEGKEAGGALLALAVEGFGREEGGGRFEGDMTLAHGFVSAEDLGVEEVGGSLSDVVGEAMTDE